MPPNGNDGRGDGKTELQNFDFDNFPMDTV